MFGACLSTEKLVFHINIVTRCLIELSAFFKIFFPWIHLDFPEKKSYHMLKVITLPPTF